MNQPAPIPAPIVSLRPRIRHSLAQWAISYKSKYGDIATKKLEISRTNGTTKRKEQYVTQRPEQYAKNPMIKLVDIWCRLRAYAGATGLIKERRSKMIEMAVLCECSINKLRPALKELHRMDWLHVDDYCIQVKSEKHVYALCQLDFNKKIDRTFSKTQKLQDEKQTHYWIYLADIDDNRKRQAFVFFKKIMQSPELKMWVYGHVQQQGYKISDAEKDPMLVCRILNDHYRTSFHSRETEMYDWLVENRPDVNRGVKGMAEAWDTCPQNVSYIKSMLVKQHLAFVQKIGTISSPGFSHNKYCRVMYNFATKVTFQAFCDDITPRQSYSPSILEKYKIAA